MSQPRTPQQTMQMRYVIAESVLEGQLDLRTYPFRHLAVIALPGKLMGIRLLTRLTGLMTAVEILSQWSWSLVNVTMDESLHTYIAFLRRE